MDDEGDESVVVEAVGNLQVFSPTLGKTPAPRAPAPESEMSLTGLWVPGSEQCHWSNDTVDGTMEAYVDRVSVHGSPKE